MRGAFLDRDGTVVEERDYITRPEGIVLLPGAATAIVRFRAAGWKVVVASNQASVAKGIITEEQLSEINLRMLALLGEAGAVLDGVYCCPHHPEGTVEEYAVECDCRKPRPGLLERAAAEHGIDLSRSVMIGDTRRDIGAGLAAGAKTVLVRTGKGARTLLEPHGADHVADDLAAAAEWALGACGAI